MLFPRPALCKSSKRYCGHQSRVVLCVIYLVYVTYSAIFVPVLVLDIKMSMAYNTLTKAIKYMSRLDNNHYIIMFILNKPPSLFTVSQRLPVSCCVYATAEVRMRKGVISAAEKMLTIYWIIVCL